MIDAYSPLKATRYLDRIEKVRRGVPAAPVHVQVILSDVCDQACNFCAYRDPTYTSSQLFYTIEPDSKRGLRRDAEHPERNFNPNRQIPTTKVFEILDDLVDLEVKGVQYTGGGEPTTHPDFEQIVHATDDRGLKWALVTNGVNVHRKAYAKACATAEWVRFSLDCGTPETYAKVRNVPAERFSDALYAISDLRNWSEALGTRTTIGVGFVVTPENWKEVVLGAKLARDHGADNIRISAQFSSDEERRFADFYEECAVLCKEAESLATPTFQVYNRFGEKLGDLRQRRPDYERCGYQQLTTYIGGDLNLYRCCVFAYHPTGLYGSIRERRFKDVWMEQSRADGMRTFDPKKCDRCQFNKINSVLEYVLAEDDPPHAEFV